MDTEFAKHSVITAKGLKAFKPLIAYNGRYMVSAPTTNDKLSTDLHWRINYIQCYAQLNFKL